MERLRNRTPEQELSIEVTDVNGIHVDNVNVLEPGKGEVRKDFTAKTTCTNDEDLALVP